MQHENAAVIEAPNHKSPGGAMPQPSDAPVAFANAYVDPQRGQWLYGSQAGGTHQFANSVVGPNAEQQVAVRHAVMRNNPGINQEALRNVM